MYEKSKAQINIDPEAHEIRAAKEAYQNITNVRGSFSNRPCGDKLNAPVTVFLLSSADLQEEIRSHQEQVDLDGRQARLPQRCQELFATERRELLLLCCFQFSLILSCHSNFVPFAGGVQVRQREYEGLRDPRG